MDVGGAGRSNVANGPTAAGRPPQAPGGRPSVEEEEP
jgi:hypothetical protein